jgi:hypothetical protein
MPWIGLVCPAHILPKIFHKSYIVSAYIHDIDCQHTLKSHGYPISHLYLNPIDSKSRVSILRYSS